MRNIEDDNPSLIIDESKQNAEKLFVIDFGAPWCGPCKALAPTMHKLSDEYAGKAEFVYVDIAENAAFCSEFKIQSVPSIVFMKNGTTIDNIVGLNSESTIKTKIDSLI